VSASVALELARGAPAHLVERAIRLAASPWVVPERVREAVAALLERGAEPDAAAVMGALEDAADGGGRDLAPAAEAARAAERLRALGAGVHLVGTSGYPPALLQAWPELGAPVWLFSQARAGLLPAGPAVAVVGTRRPTADGLHTAGNLARLLARHGVVVVSGMARGIDQAAHRGALQEDGVTIAVLGAGFGVDYPGRSSELRRAVADSGGLVTEYLPGVRPRPPHFLWRNRIIAGLADVTVVVEGGERSGALQTARLAAAQGRDVLAVPGSVNAPASRAPLDLIRDGARPLTRLEEVLEALDGRPAAALEAARARRCRGLAPAAQALLGLLGPVPATAAALAAASGRPVGEVLAAIADLDDRGLARITPRGVVATP
jgi:DNA processing protein